MLWYSSEIEGVLYEWEQVTDADELRSMGHRLGLCVADPSVTPYYYTQYLGSEGTALLLKANYRPLAIGALNTRLNKLLTLKQRIQVRLPLQYGPVVLDLIRAKDLGVHDVDCDFRSVGIFEHEGHLMGWHEVVPGQVFESSLNLNNVRLKHMTLPEGLVIKGDLYMCRTFVHHLPSRLEVHGDLYLLFNEAALPIPDSITVLGKIFT